MSELTRIGFRVPGAPFIRGGKNPSAAQQKASGKKEYARLVKLEIGHFVFYCFADDSFALAHLKDEAQKREQVYQQLVAEINPAFTDKVAVYFFPDQLSKRILTMHQAWAGRRAGFWWRCSTRRNALIHFMN